MRALGAGEHWQSDGDTCLSLNTPELPCTALASVTATETHDSKIRRTENPARKTTNILLFTHWKLRTRIWEARVRVRPEKTQERERESEREEKVCRMHHLRLKVT